MYLLFGRSSVGLKTVQLHKGVHLVSVCYCYCLVIPMQIEEVNPPTGPQTVARRLTGPEIAVPINIEYLLSCVCAFSKLSPCKVQSVMNSNRTLSEPVIYHLQYLTDSFQRS